jgi:hypothetical protein
MEVSVQLYTRPLYPQRKSPWYPLDRRLGGGGGRPEPSSGSGGKEINSQPLLGLEPPIIQPVAERYIIELPRLKTFFIVYFIC